MGGEAGVPGGREFGEPPRPDPLLTAPCARSPGLPDGRGRLRAAAAAAVAAAPAAPTVRPPGQGLRADASLRGRGAGKLGAPGGPGWVLGGRGLASTQGVARATAGKAGRWRQNWLGSADVCSFSRSCLLTPGKGPPALGPSRGPGRSWAVWYRGPRGVALPCPPGDPQAEGLAASYRPLSASSQSSLRSLISAL